MKKSRKDTYKYLRYYLLAVAFILTIPILVSLNAFFRSLLTFAIFVYVIGYYNRAWLSTLIKRIRFPKFRRIYITFFVLFAVFGIFTLGFILGSIGESAFKKDDIATTQNTKSEQMRDVLDNYQGLSKLFYLQQQDMDIIVDSSKWQDDPQELTDAIDSYKQKKNAILFQWGKLYELRKKAGLTSDTFLKLD